MKSFFRLVAAFFVFMFRLAWAILAGLFTFLWELVKLPFTLARLSKPPVDGHDYEYRVAEYLRRRGYHSVSVTQASGDYGADVIAKKGTKKYAIQCKYYSSPVGVAAVQEVTAAKAHYGCNAAMVVTNNTFTAAAEKLAAENGVVLLPGVTGMRVKKNKPVKQKSAAPIRAAQKIETAPAPVNIHVPTEYADCYLIKDIISEADPQLLISDENVMNLTRSAAVSISALQRRFKIGYTRAAHIMDSLIERDYVEFQSMDKGQILYRWTAKAQKG